ncbi:hypothetical protein [Chryseobacterium sp. EO14]|uniref:hypothetical protein n=1 Tax=Chryseobacterium sp. EO14 TaxID=2950551 RepID=UPI002108AC6A|nr:hypothetical protein [Chryseobacterium sp. EO14]MCQ4138612.1 hypothetical protein [Chryseobacterium sp. EO14]
MLFILLSALIILDSLYHYLLVPFAVNSEINLKKFLKYAHSGVLASEVSEIIFPLAKWFRKFPIVCNLGRNTLGEFRKFTPSGEMVSGVPESVLLSAVALERRLQGLRILLHHLSVSFSGIWEI